MSAPSRPENTLSPQTISPKLRSLIEAVVFELRLPETGRRYLWERIESGPSRAVQSRIGNRVYNFHSRKMGMRHKLESHRGEFVMACLLERDDNVIAYFAQPPAISLQSTRADGTITNRSFYTPDMLVVRKNRIEVIETREDKRLQDSCVANSHQFYRDGTGKWHYRAAEEYFEALGMGYELRANTAQPLLLVENARFLGDYIREDAKPIAPEIAQALVQTVAERKFVPVRSLLGEGFAADDIYKAIADGMIYVDLEADRMAATSDLAVYQDKATRLVIKEAALAAQQPTLPIPGAYVLKPGSLVHEGEATHTVVACNEREVLLRREDGTGHRMGLDALIQADELGHVRIQALQPKSTRLDLSQVSDKELNRATAKLTAMETSDTTQYSARSLSRFRQAVARAGNRLDSLIALLGKTEQRGNRQSRISVANLELIDKAVKLYYNTEQNRSVKGAWDKYAGLCNEATESTGQPIMPVSYQTFSKLCKDRKSVQARLGKRAAYQVRPIVSAMEEFLPVHGVRPHEICYIDHTIANIELVSPHGVKLGKPTLTLGIDGFTTQTRAMFVSFDPPSTVVVLMVLRDYVRRNGRLPDCISIDNGKEFHSKELEIFCALYEIDLRYRAPGQPRGGAMIERLLGATEVEMLTEMKGNSTIMKANTRLVTKSVNPINFAEWTLPALYGALEEYCFRERPTRIHPSLGVTPVEREANGVTHSGQREIRGVRFDESFVLMTSPHASHRMHKVDPQRGVWVNGMWYQHAELRGLKKGTQCEIRIEPWNARVVYVNTGKRWVSAMGNNTRWLLGRTTREVEIALREESRKAKSDAERERISVAARRRRQIMLRPQDFDSRLAIQQREMLLHYAEIGMGAALPEAREFLEPLPADTSAPASLRRTLTTAGEPTEAPANAASSPIGIASADAPNAAAAAVDVSPITTELLAAINGNVKDPGQENGDDGQPTVADDTERSRPIRIPVSPPPPPQSDSLLRRTRRFL